MANMFQDKPTIEENKKDRMLECNEKLQESLDKLLLTLEGQDFDEQLWEELEELIMKCHLRAQDLEEEIRFS